MHELYAVKWINPDTGISGEMHNIRRHALEDVIDRAWDSAGPSGQVAFEKENHEVVEYAEL